MVEHRLAKARVASSNLVSRSKPPSGDNRVGYGGMERYTSTKGSPAKARYPSGKGEVCKTFMRRFDPARASNLFNTLCKDDRQGQRRAVAGNVAGRCRNRRCASHIQRWFMT